MTSKSAIDIAKTLLGIKYVFGGESMAGFDCSGLVQYSFKKIGINLPRTAAQQQRATTKISMANARPGDLVFYGYPAHHVGIYLGNGKFIEAPHTGDVVKIANVGSGESFGRVPGYTDALAVGGAAGKLDIASMIKDTYVSYGYVSSMANAVPEIGNLLKQAAKANWSPQKFQDKLQDTTWWKTHSDSAKKIIQLSYADPAEFKQQTIAAERHVHQIALSLGVTLSTGQIKQLATTDMMQGLDDATLTSQIGGLYKPGGPNGSFGQAATLTHDITQLAGQYGMPVTDKWISTQVRNALGTGGGAEAAQAQLEKMAETAYPTLAKQIQQGQTVADIAQPYMAQMGQLLEVDPATITLQDPTISKALHGQLPAAGAPAPAAGAKAAAPTAPSTLYDFANALRADPRWDKTDNAKASAYSMVYQLGKTFGFAS